MMYVVLDAQTEYYTHTHEKCRLHMEFWTLHYTTSLLVIKMNSLAFMQKIN